MKLVAFSISIATIILHFLPIFAYSSHKHGSHQEVKVSEKRLYEIKVHGFLHWASMGFLIPVGVLIIRLSNREESGRRLRILFYTHATLQMLAVIFTTAGAITSILYFENSFQNAHQRLGLALYGAVWLQSLVGFFRPKRGSRGRSVWFVGHWIFGTTVTMLGIINIYTGLHAYHERTSNSISLWSVLFTFQISILAFLYLFQDKWAYIKRQGIILGRKPVQPTEMVPPRDRPKNSLINSC